MIPLIRCVQIRNYKSLAQVHVTLGPLTILVGPNGAGKSNFIEALAFVKDCLSESIEMAFTKRGGIGAVRRRSGGHPTHIGMRLMLNLDDGIEADYSFEIAARPKEKFRIARERCVVRHFMGSKEYRFEIRDGVFSTKIPGIQPQIFPDRLALYAASAIQEFRPVYDFLTAMQVYAIAPQRLRELQEPDPGDLLNRDGSNAAAVLKHLQEQKPPERYQRLCRLLARVVEGVERVEYRTVGQKETLQFRQDVGSKHPWTFESLNMSHGTLRVLGLLLAVYQTGQPTMMAIEEPEATVHPAVAELVFEVFLDAAHERQVLMTTHSPDILDSKVLNDSQIRAVTMKRGRTWISPLAPSSREAIRERLYTPGELLRADELEPDLSTAQKASEQLNLFGPPMPAYKEQLWVE